MNTTELIKHWTMQGAAPDVGVGFWSTAAIPAITAEDREPPTLTSRSVGMRRSDEEEWTTLLPVTGDK